MASDEEIKELILKLEPGGYHILPRGDIGRHTHSPSCWCGPKLEHRDMKKGVEVWIHRLAKEDKN